MMLKSSVSNFVLKGFKLFCGTSTPKEFSWQRDWEHRDKVTAWANHLVSLCTKDYFFREYLLQVFMDKQKGLFYRKNIPRFMEAWARYFTRDSSQNFKSCEKRFLVTSATNNSLFYRVSEDFCDCYKCFHHKLYQYDVERCGASTKTELHCWKLRFLSVSTISRCYKEGKRIALEIMSYLAYMWYSS